MSKLIEWLEVLKKNQNFTTQELEKHRNIANHLLSSKKVEDLGILVKAIEFNNTLVSPEQLELKCTNEAPFLLEKLRNYLGFNKNRIESNILKTLHPEEAIKKVTHWYQNDLPESVQIILAWKVYKAVYKQLTTGQLTDKSLTEEQAKLIVDTLNYIPKIINNSKAVEFIIKAAAYVLRTGDTYDFKKHHLPENYNELVLSSIWLYTQTLADKLTKETWKVHAASITLMNNKLISSNLAWLQMYDNNEYKKLNTYLNADTKEINTYLNQQRLKIGNPESLLSKKHIDNAPGDIYVTLEI